MPATVLPSRTDFQRQSYRIEDFSNAANIYRELAEAHASHYDEENDLRINSGATDAQLEWKKQGDSVRKKKPSREDLEVFESAYNAACGAIARGEMGQSEVLLNRARGIVSYPMSNPPNRLTYW